MTHAPNFFGRSVKYKTMDKKQMKKYADILVEQTECDLDAVDREYISQYGDILNEQSNG